MLSFNAAIFINTQLVCANYVFIFWIIDQSRLMILILGQILMTNKENSHFTAKKSLNLHWLTFSCMRETQQQQSDLIRHQRFIKLVKIHQLEESKCRTRNVEE